VLNPRSPVKGEEKGCGREGDGICREEMEITEERKK
jgi:hypothetical protein